MVEFLQTQLANGLKIIAERNASAVSASVGFFVETGPRDESPDVSGISHFIEHLLFKGTVTKSVDDVNRLFDDSGADYNAYTCEEQTAFFASVPPESLLTVTQLWAELMHPAFRETDIEMERQVVLEEIRMYDDCPPFGMDEKSRQIFFGDHPLGNSTAGTIDTVSSITPEMLRQYFATHYSPDRMFLAAAGQVDFDAIVRVAEKYCGDMQPSGVTRALQTPQPHFGRHHFTRESAQQLYAMQYTPAPTVRDPDRFAAKMMAMLVGDESGSRMFWEITDPGLADTASLNHCDYLDAGSFLTWMSCEPEEANANLDRLKDLYDVVERDGFHEDELLRARNKMASGLVLSGERPRGRLFSIAGLQVQQMPYLSVRDELDIVEQITLDDIHAVLRKYPLSHNLTVTIGPQLVDSPASQNSYSHLT